MATNIGIMDSAYFVGRNEILSWINNRLQLNLSRIEEAASGAVQCQMMDVAHRGVVPMHKHIEVSRLVKGRPLDNLEFLQWLKRYCDSVADLKLTVDAREKERDFYFAKLRDIEIICQTPEVENISITVAIKKILYATDTEESVLDEALDYLNQTVNAVEAQDYHGQTSDAESDIEADSQN
ncbi:hypothetical protein RYX36_026523 [Vicia faba]